jgi:hypothetical protein
MKTPKIDRWETTGDEMIALDKDGNEIVRVSLVEFESMVDWEDIDDVRWQD